MNDVDKLLENLDLLSYPDTMTKVRQRVSGVAFFPVGNGSIPSEPSISGKKYMILGQDFDTVDNYEKVLEQGEESLSGNPTWSNLLKLLEEAAILKEDCFFTNAIPALRSTGLSYGKSPAFKDPEFIEACRKFFLLQIKMQQPKAVFVLGKEVAKFLSFEIAEWKIIASFNAVDSANLQVLPKTLSNGIKSTFVLLTHPSFRGSNVHRRTYEVANGHEAEVKMIQKAVG